MYYKMDSNINYLTVTIFILFILYISTGVVVADNLEENHTYEIGDQIDYDFGSNISEATIGPVNEFSNKSVNISVNKTGTTSIYTSNFTEGRYKLVHGINNFSKDQINFTLTEDSLDVKVAEKKITSSQNSSSKIIVENDFNEGRYSIESRDLNITQMEKVFNAEDNDLDNKLEFNYSDNNILEGKFWYLESGNYSFKVRDLTSNLTESREIQVIDSTNSNVVIRDVDTNVTKNQNIEFTIYSENTSYSNIVIKSDKGYYVDFNILNLTYSGEETQVVFDPYTPSLKSFGRVYLKADDESSPYVDINYKRTVKNVKGTYEISARQSGKIYDNISFDVTDKKVEDIKILSKSNNTFAESVGELKNQSYPSNNIAEYDKVIIKVDTNYIERYTEDSYIPYKENGTTKIDIYSDVYINVSDDAGNKNIINVNQSRVYMDNNTKSFFVIVEVDKFSNLRTGRNYTVKAGVEGSNSEELKENFSISDRYIKYNSTSDMNLTIDDPDTRIKARTNIANGTIVPVIAENEDLETVKYNKTVKNNEFNINLSKLDLKRGENFTLYTNQRVSVNGFVELNNESKDSGTENIGIIQRIIRFFKNLFW